MYLRRPVHLLHLLFLHCISAPQAGVLAVIFSLPRTDFIFMSIILCLRNWDLFCPVSNISSHFAPRTSKNVTPKRAPEAANKVFLAAGQQTQTEKTPVFCISCSNILVLNNQKVFCEHSSVLPPDVGSEIHIFKLQPKRQTLWRPHTAKPWQKATMRTLVTMAWAYICLPMHNMSA